MNDRYPVIAPRRSGPPLILLVGLTALSALSINIFVPSIPGLSTYFAAPGAVVQLTLTLYLLTVGVGQLLYGPLSDRFGRRPILLVGLAIYVVGCAICLASPAIEVLLGGRVIQAAGGCAGLVLGRAMVRDMYNRQRTASMLGYMTMTMAMATAFAPFAGAYLEEWQGWRAGFLTMTILGAMLLLASWRLARETLAEPAPLPSAVHMIGIYRAILKTRRFRKYGGFSICLLASYYAFVAGAPHVVITLFHQAPSQFGLYYIFAGLAYITGNFLAGRFSERRGVVTMTVAGGVIVFLSGMAMIALAALDIRHPLAVFAPIAISFIGSGLSQPSAMAAAIDAIPRYIGSGSAMLGALQLASGALASVIIGLTESDGPLPLAIVSGGLLIAAFAVLVFCPAPATDPGSAN